MASVDVLIPWELADGSVIARDARVLWPLGVVEVGRSDAGIAVRMQVPLAGESLAAGWGVG